MVTNPWVTPLWVPMGAKVKPTSLGKIDVPAFWGLLPGFFCLLILTLVIWLWAMLGQAGQVPDGGSRACHPVLILSQFVSPSSVEVSKSGQVPNSVRACQPTSISVVRFPITSQKN